jgi:hypothetical protein
MGIGIMASIDLDAYEVGFQREKATGFVRENDPFDDASFFGSSTGP